MGKTHPRYAKRRWWKRYPPRGLVRRFDEIQLARKHGGGVHLAPVKEREPWTTP
jgi:hypothetical protein